MTAAGHPKIPVIPVIAVMPSGKTAPASTERMDNSILSSECAFSCKMKLEVMKRQGFRTDLTSSQLGTKLQTDDIVAECFGIGKTTVQPFIRLMELMPPILQMGNGGNRPHACGGAVLFEERGTRTAADILFSVGKCGMVVTMKGKKNLFAALKEELENKCFYLD